MVESHGVRPALVDVLAASRRIGRHLVPTPMRRSGILSELIGRDVWLKPENQQITGSFKFRGALNRMMLHRERSGSPVIVVSSGNQAIGVVTAGRIVGVEATVVVPESVTPSKLDALRTLGARVEIAGSGFDEAEAAMYEIAAGLGAEVVSSFDADVIAGHATTALEMIHEVPELSAILAPVASGGLLAGTALVASAISSSCTVYGVQAANAPVMHTALRNRELMYVHEIPTIADGLAGNVMGSVLPFEIIKALVPEVLLVREESIYTAIGHLSTRDRLVAEGAGAASVAAVIEGQVPQGSGPIGVIVSGGNVAPEILRDAINTVTSEQTD